MDATDTPAGLEPSTEEDCTRRIVVIILIGLSALLFLVSAWSAFVKMPPKLDEKGHVQQIRLFADGKLDLARAPGDPHPANAMLPGYHAVTALYAKIVGTSQGALRSFNLLLLLLFGWLFHHHLRQRGDDSFTAIETTACICFFPPLFAIANLVYTDLLALILALLAVLQCQRNNHRTAALFGCLGLLVRQNLVVLCGILFLIAVFQERKRNSRSLAKIIAEAAWPYLLPCLFFVVFFANNDFRVGLDRPSAQPNALSVGNLLFSLFCLTIWLWPMLIDWAREGCRRLKTLPPWLWILVVVVPAVLAFVYRPTHEWNQLAFMLRNVALYHLTQSAAGRTVFAVATIVAIVSLLGLHFKSRSDQALAFSTWFLMLIPALLVEPRYYVPIFAIVLALRIPKERWQLRALAWAWCLILSAATQYLQATTDKLL
jgi:hypothetical protein